jgi:hypothetical protein
MTTRVFTVEVTGCKDCPDKGNELNCFHDSRYAIEKQRKLCEENYNTITPSCPMYQYSFVKDEKK